MSEADKLKAISAGIRDMLNDALTNAPLPLPVQPLGPDGEPLGPPITTWRELHASGAFADPVRDALAVASAAVKKAEDLVRERYLANTNGDAAALREVLSQLVQAGIHTHKAGEAWKPHEYPRKIEEEKS